MKFKRIVAGILSLAIALPCFTVFASADGADISSLSEGKADVSSEIVVKGGAKSVVSMTYDDGSYDNALWLNEMFAKYGLKGSCMMIPKNNKVVPSDANSATIAKWVDVFEKGYLSPENHSMTHLVLPAPGWSDGTNYYDDKKHNNTPENYQYELLDSKTALEEAFGYPILTFAPSNNTLWWEAVDIVKENYYVMRQGTRANSYNTVQSLSPIEGSDEKGGWYNLYMYGIDNTTLENDKKWVQQCIDEGGWFVSMTHGVIGEAGKAERFEEFYRFLAEKQRNNDVWVTTFRDATIYLREKQNSTSSAYMTDDGVFVSVSMKDTTGDGLPLDSSIFNMPLTVKVEVPKDWAVVSYKQGGKTMYSNAFAEGGKNYVYVDATPNGEELALTSIEFYEGGEIANIAGYITADGGFVVGDMIASGYADKFRVDENVKVYAKFSVADFEDNTTAVVPIRVADDVTGSINIYGVLNKALSDSWSAETLNPYNAPANDIFGTVTDGAAFIGTLDVMGSDTYLADITTYIEDMKASGAEYATVIFTISEESQAKKIGFDFGTLEDVPTDGTGAAVLYTFKQDFEAASGTGGFRTGGIGANENNSFKVGEAEGYLGETTKCIVWKSTRTYERNFLGGVLNTSNELSETDIGSVYKISFRLKAERAGQFVVWLGNSKTVNPYTDYPQEKCIIYTISEENVGKWIKYTATFTIDESNLVVDATDGGQDAYFAITPSSFGQGKEDPVMLYLDDIVSNKISEGASEGGDTTVFTPYSFTQNFENSSGNGGFRTGGIGANEKNSFSVGETEGYNGETTKCIIWKTTRTYERNFLPNVLNASNTLTSSDVGSLYRITFRLKAERAGEFVVWLGNNKTVGTYSSTPTEKVYFTIPEEDVGKWIKYTCNFTVTENNLLTDETKGGQNNCFAITPKSFAQSPDDPVMLYLDDITSTKVNLSAKSAMIPTESKAITSSDGKMFIGGEKSDKENLRYAYIQFDAAKLNNALSTELSLVVKAASEQKIKIYGLLGASVSADMTFTEAPGFKNGKIDSSSVFSGVPMYEGTARAGTISFDIASYVKSQTENCVFLVITEDINEKKLVYFDFESLPVTEGFDFTTSGTVSISDGVMNVSDTVAFDKMFRQANIGDKYLVSAKVSAGVTLTAGQSSATASDNGLISLEVVYSEDISSVVFSAQTAFTIDDLKIELASSPVVIAADSTVLVLMPTSYDFSVITPHVSIRFTESVEFCFYINKIDDLTYAAAGTKEYGKEELESASTKLIEGKEYYVFAVPFALSDVEKPLEISIGVGNSDGYLIYRTYSYVPYEYMERILNDAEYKYAKDLVLDLMSYIRAEKRYLDNAADVSKINTLLFNSSYYDGANINSDQSVYRPDAQMVEAVTVDVIGKVKYVFTLKEEYCSERYSLTFKVNGFVIPGQRNEDGSYTLILPLDHSASKITLTLTDSEGTYISTDCNLKYCTNKETDEYYKAVLDRLSRCAESLTLYKNRNS